MPSCIKTLSSLLDLTDEQCILIISITSSFLLQSIVLCYLNPNKFTLKWFITCLCFCVLYNISYFKLFLR